LTSMPRTSAMTGAVGWSHSTGKIHTEHVQGGVTMSSGFFRSALIVVLAEALIALVVLTW
jgi:hypothetical protein